MDATLVLFDIDGTLIYTAGAGRRAIVEAVARHFGVDGVGRASASVRFAGKTDPIIVAEVARLAGVPEARWNAEVSDFWRTYLECLREELERPDPRRRAMPGVPRLLETLRARPEAHLGLLTGNIEAGARLKLAAFGLEHYFPGGGFASDHPDRTVIARIAREKLARHYGIAFDPQRTVVVGDTELDVTCGRVHGFRTVALDGGWVPREQLEAARPDAILRTFENLEESLAALGLEPHRPARDGWPS